MLKFVLPSDENRADVLDFYREIAEYGGECIGKADSEDYAKWLKNMQNRYDGKNLPQGYVRENFYLCYDGEELVGVFSLKFELTKFLLDFGGHVGYAVRPQKRNRGYATKILEQGLRMAKDLGFNRILCVCDEDNYASEKVIVKNGGVLENTLYDPDECVVVKRYWVNL